MRINYPLVIYKTEQLDELTQRLKRMSADMKQLVVYGRNGWRGEAANAYLESCIRLDDKIKTAADHMNNFSIAIRNTANGIKKADEELAALKAAEIG